MYRISKLHRQWVLDREAATLLRRGVVQYGSPGDTKKKRFRFTDKNNASSRVADTKWTRVLMLVDAKANKERSEASSHEDVAKWKGRRNTGGENWWAKRPKPVAKSQWGLRFS